MIDAAVHDDVVIYTWGICHASVCAPALLTLAEIERQANRQLPTGVGPWQKDDSPTFSNGASNPCPCERSPSERVHYLLSC